MNGMPFPMRLLRTDAAQRWMRSLATGICALTLLLSATSQAAAGDAIVTPVDNAKRAALADQGAPWAQPKNDLGAVPADLTLDHLSLVLRRSPERQLAYDQLLREQQDAASPNYHHWLSPNEIGERFGATQHDIDALSNWLLMQGFSVAAVANSRTRIHFSGRAADVASAFGTELHYFQADAEKRIANTVAASIPAAFADAVRYVIGLSPITFRPAHRIIGARKMFLGNGSPQPAETSCNGTVCSHLVFPADFAKIYNLEPVYQQNIDGSGQTIAIVGLARTSEPDIMNFQTLSGLAIRYPTIIIPPGGTDPGPAATTCSETGTPSCGHPSDLVSEQGEATLDVERAGSVAPGAAVKLIISANTASSDGVQTAIEYAIDTTPVPANILSISFGGCEAESGGSGSVHWLDDLFSQAAMEGISTFVASGDSGVADCADPTQPPPAVQVAGTNALCSSGYVTCVGGTEFADTANPSAYWASSNGADFLSAFGYIPEGAWNEPTGSDGSTQLAATGGGVSAYIPTPSWQVGTGVPGQQGRYTPDVSFGASLHDAYFGCMAAEGASCVVTTNGSFQPLGFGGTSASAPSMAGIAALLNQNAGSAQANLNPRFYALAANPTNGVFHDVTVASSGVTNCTLAIPSLCNNTTPGPSGLSGGLPGYRVGTGYDLATGLGSIDVANLLAQWSNPNAGAVNLDQHGLTGSWDNPAINGQGIVMEVEPDFYGAGTGLLFAGWYTNDVTAVGGQRWYTLQAQVSSNSASVTSSIYLTQGGSFASSLATTTTPVGQATLQFSDCTHGSLQYNFSDGSARSGTIPLTRLDANVTCGQAGDNGSAAASYLLSGAWYNPATSGQGLVFDVNPIQNVLFAGWYTYASNAGQGSGPAGQRWYTLQATLVPGTSSVNSIGIYDTTGGVFNQAAPIATHQVGNATLVYHSCSSATLAYTFTAGANAGLSGTLNLSRLGAVPNGCHL